MGVAINELLEARSRAVGALELNDPDDPTQPFLPQTLPQPAASVAIAELEEAIGTLPPSYRHFFEIHDGLPQADMGADLFSLSELLAFRNDEAGRVYARIADEIDNRSPDRLVFLGASDSRKSVFLFDGSKTDEFGEWTVLDYTDEDGLLDEHSSFWEFIQDLTNTLRATAEAYEE